MSKNRDFVKSTPGRGDEVVAELREAHDEVHRRLLQVGRDLEAGVLPPGINVMVNMFGNFDHFSVNILVTIIFL
jgi:hypothetical protein